MISGFLINKVPGGSVLSASAEFDVRGYAVRLVLAGASGGDSVVLQVLAGNTVAKGGTWAPVAYNGVAIALNATNNQYEIAIEGHYRVVYSGGSSTLQVWMETDSLGLDQKSFSTFSAPAIISGVGATGPTGPTGSGPTGPTGATGATGPGGGGFTPPYIANSSGNPFNMGTTSAVYGVSSSGQPALPLAASAVNVIMGVAAIGANVTVTPTAPDTLNGSGTGYTVTTAVSGKWFYSDGISNWITI